MTLTQLPKELLHCIIQYFSHVEPVINLLKTNKQFKHKLNQVGDINIGFPYQSPFLIPCENYFSLIIDNAKFIKKIMTHYPKCRLRYEFKSGSEISHDEIKLLNCVDIKTMDNDDTFYQYDNITCINGVYKSIEQYENRTQDVRKYLNLDGVNGGTVKCRNTRSITLFKCTGLTIDCQGCYMRIDIKSCNGITFTNSDNCEICIYKCDNICMDNMISLDAHMSTNCTFDHITKKLIYHDMTNFHGKYVNTLQFGDNDSNNVSIKQITKCIDVDFDTLNKIQGLEEKPTIYQYEYMPKYDNAKMIGADINTNNVLFNKHPIKSFYINTCDPDAPTNVRNVKFNFIDCPDLHIYSAGMCSVYIKNCPELKDFQHDYEDSANSDNTIINCPKLKDVPCMGSLNISNCPSVCAIKNIAYGLKIRNCHNIEQLTFNWFWDYFGVIDWGKDIKAGQLKLDIDALPNLKVIIIALKRVPINYILSKTKNPKKVKILINAEYKKFYKNVLKNNKNAKLTDGYCHDIVALWDKE